MAALSEGEKALVVRALHRACLGDDYGVPFTDAERDTMWMLARDRLTPAPDRRP